MLSWKTNNKGCYSILSPVTSINKVVQFNVCQADDEVAVVNKKQKQSTIGWNTVPKKSMAHQSAF